MFLEFIVLWESASALELNLNSRMWSRIIALTLSHAWKGKFIDVPPGVVFGYYLSDSFTPTSLSRLHFLE